MDAPPRRSSSAGTAWLAVHLHEVSAGLAVGIGLMKGWQESRPGTVPQAPKDALDVLEQVLGELKELSRTVAGETLANSQAATLRECLIQEANSIGVELDLEVAGRESSLSKEEAELIRVVCREAIRNVKRHSGTSGCRIRINLSARPFVLTVRDWGAGIGALEQAGDGLALLEALAGEIGAELKVSSQPGLGVQVSLKGPMPGTTDLARGPGTSVRSVVAKESLSSRKRVAARRPFSGFEQQIT